MHRPPNEESAHRDALLRARLGLALALFEAADYDGAAGLRNLETLAVLCAAHGVPAETVHRMVDDGVLEALGDADPYPVTEMAGLLHSTVTRAYLR
ncbi:hypothetical protein ACFVMC_16590 [Nocardia sp. NPDC127579]|uniref:hypothetical protein n=1 Tax=Nocardia sp. NPDC127579 TaxID=3345402 RepID=UPI0036309042